MLARLEEDLIMIKLFDVIYYYKVHENIIFDEILNKEQDIKIKYVKDGSGHIISKYFKARPAIVVDKLVQNNERNFLVIIIPLTSKAPEKFLENYRPDIKIFKKKSYMMLESMQILNDKQFKNFPIKNGKPISLSMAQKKYIYNVALKRGVDLKKIKLYLKKEEEKGRKKK